VALVLATLGSVRRHDPASASEAADVQPPNIVVILTDDMRTDEMDALRKTNDLLVDDGTSFTNAIAPTSLCCPARAALLTGTYSHTNGVWSNQREFGGWSTFQSSEDHTIATALDAVGYHTGFFGKYVNGWASTGTFTVPPGWDSFAGMRDQRGGEGAYYHYDLLGSAPTQSYGTNPEDYSTDVLAQRTVDFISSTSPTEPFLAFYAPYAPHGPATSAPRYKGTWPPENVVPPANERDMSDKPLFMQQLPLLARKDLNTTLRKQHEALLPVDDAVDNIVTAVGPDRVANTLFVFTSDNSLLNGDHRLTGKNAPYAGSTEIPMVMRWDGVIDPGALSSRLFTLQDVTATIVEASSASLPTEGVSWLSGSRSGSVIEAMETPQGGVIRPAYCGWRTPRYLYVRYSNGAGEELYDYSTDPAELRNAISNPQYSAIADQMRTSAQAACNPTPPGFSWDQQPTP
jgi:arylsulfatase A-like enzyme